MIESTCLASWQHERRGYRFDWNLQHDRAEVRRVSDKALVWGGSLLPLLWVQDASGSKRALKAAVTAIEPAGDHRTIQLQFGDAARGAILARANDAGIHFERLTLRWNDVIPAIIDLYFGAAPLTETQRDIVPTLDQPYWPDWEAEGFCIPSAKGSPVQSFFRCWDFGHATIPLGSFGPGMGTPYAAAFPRPLFTAGMGGASGWVTLGPGEIADAAVALQIQSSCAALQFRHREDLHGVGESQREWNQPLRLAWAESAWDAYLTFFETFDVPPGRHPVARSNVNSWGSFKTGDFDLRRLADRALKLGAELVVIDDFWERLGGIGEPDRQRFLAFDADLDYIRSKGLAIGFWQSIGWIDDPAAAGLTNDDLICGVDGRPRLANWAMNPHLRGRSHYCMDPSSERVRDFLKRRTQTIMRQFTPALLKLDFGYGLPGPDVAVPRNPKFRGERLAFELLRLISSAAREVDPEVRIQYYGLHPLMREVTDVIALDDLGDAGNAEAAGHGQWSVWSALASQSGVSLMASSGYEWEVDSDILLNTVIVGAPGCVLPMNEALHPAFTQTRLLRRRAIALWYRRTTTWRPLWLDSQKGSLSHEPATQCWGRLENLEGDWQLTALALRPTLLRQSLPESLPTRGWEGRWAVLAQDDRPIRRSQRIACVPFDDGHLEIELESSPARVLAVTLNGEQPAPEATITGTKVRINAAAGTREGFLGYLIVTA